jgi:hypothetical protein
MASNAELFIEHLRSVFGEEAAIHKADVPDGGPPVSVFVYKNIPEKGMITGVTYGLSLHPLPAWKFSRPEMLVAVQSLDLGWPCSAATFVALFRGKKLFQYGDVFTTDGPLAEDSKMDGFLVFAQSILSDKYVAVKLNDYKIHFSQFYPIYKEELAVYENIGLEAFWKHKGFDMYDVTRKPIKAR